MAQKKAHEVDGWLTRPDPSIPLILVYGPDRGLVSERARRFASGLGLPLDDPFVTVRLSADALDADPGRLLDEARTVPMFADRRLLWISGAPSSKTFADAVTELASDPPREAVILIEAGDLKKTAPLRTAIEKAASAMALPCYADDARALDGLIDQVLGEAGLRIGADARRALKSALGGDRLASRMELDKLALYCAGQGEVSIEDVAAATGDAAGASVDTAVDAMLGGTVDQFDAAYGQLISSGMQPFLVLAAAMRQLQALMLMRRRMDTEGKPASVIVASARPPVFFARKQLVQNALERRDCERLSRALERIGAAILETRRRPDLAKASARQALMAVTLEGRRR